LQRPEQQSAFPAHAFPAVRQAALSGAQFPEVHVPLQQLASVVHVWLSKIQAAAAHVPATQLRVQQSVEAAHVAPAAAQAPTLDAHVFVVASQSLEQQSAPVWQRPPNG
jgi:hypothetical protein